jgi:Holliday junction resolvasome RuvABC endonuclease subunit
MCKIKLSIDQASKISGWCVTENGAIIDYGILKSSGATAGKRINSTKVLVNELIKKHKPSLIILEDIQQQRGNVKGFKTSAGLLGVLVDLLIENKIKYEVNSPSTWRSGFGFLKGGSKKRAELKQKAIDYVEAEYDIKESEDVCEAILQNIYVCNKEKREVLV